LAAQPGAKLRFKARRASTNSSCKRKKRPAAWSRRLLENKIVGGIELSRWYPELRNCTLWCATEVVTREQIDASGQVLAAAPVEA
jgi:glycine dehydrogenase subunit 1